MSIRRWVSEDAFGALHRALFALPTTSGKPLLLALVAASALTALTFAGVGAEGSTPTAPRLGRLGVHVAEHDETLFSIARRYGMSIDELARLNATTTDSFVLPGRPLWVPLASAVNARADTPAGPSEAEETGASSSGASDHTTYTVTPGDTLYNLGRRFGVSIDDLKRWNGLPIDGSLRAGDTLILHGAAEYAVAPSRAGTEAGKTREGYVVAPGDTLSSIATRFGTTSAGLRSANGLVGDSIQIGQTLLVPLKGSGVAHGGGEKRIEVDVSEQRMYVWQGNNLIWNFTSSTGMAGYPTRRGNFAVQSRIPNAWSSPWQLWMPNWLGIYWAGGSENGIHALPIVNGQRLWAGYLGTPISYGCIVLGISEAELLYNWAEIGTPVVIHD
jgi:LysM repeat protein